MNIRKLAIVCIVSWLLGVAAYLSSLYLIYGQTAGGSDLTAVLFWSFTAALFAFALIYLPIMFLLRRLLRGYKPVVAFPVVASLGFIIPTAFILGRFSTDGSGFLRSLISPEAVLFYCMFIAVGVSFGLGFVWCFRKGAI
ncbi:MAG: hypothetical protein H0U54_03685 [Acidobacteria bacterium]|jgi:hypothetical protein|nr:hypothetical protein [Acidobacteriota bacterium]